MDDLLLLLILDRISGGEFRWVVNFVGVIIVIGGFMAHPIIGTVCLIIWGVVFVATLIPWEEVRGHRNVILTVAAIPIVLVIGVALTAKPPPACKGIFHSDPNTGLSDADLGIGGFTYEEGTMTCVPPPGSLMWNGKAWVKKP
jgi:hypothetical protein